MGEQPRKRPFLTPYGLAATASRNYRSFCYTRATGRISRSRCLSAKRPVAPTRGPAIPTLPSPGRMADSIAPKPSTPLLSGIDLFAGAGGLSLGARQAGIEVELAIERDSHSAATYARNHPGTVVKAMDVHSLSTTDIAGAPRTAERTILFGGPPCSGFSYSNQKTRTLQNPDNWLFIEFLRVAREWKPDWVLLENVRGLTNTTKGVFYHQIMSKLEDLGYATSSAILNAADFGVPQNRSRLFILGSRHGKTDVLPTKSTDRAPTVGDAIHDLPLLPNGAALSWSRYRSPPSSEYAKHMRLDLEGCSNHLVTKSAPIILQRYTYVPCGGNWQNIPTRLLRSYRQPMNCHTGLYHRLNPDLPSIVIGNFRKNMLIHPTEDRGISVREAARLQSFPDWYEFLGSIGFQQQQVSNAVPPILAKTVFESIVAATQEL